MMYHGPEEGRRYTRMTMIELARQYDKFMSNNKEVKAIGPILEEARNRGLSLVDLEQIMSTLSPNR